jgi:hypothetical protein
MHQPTQTRYAEVATRAAAQAGAHAHDAPTRRAAEATTMATEACRLAEKADALAQPVIALLADNGSRDAALDLLHEAGCRSQIVRYRSCRVAELAAKVGAADAPG